MKQHIYQRNRETVLNRAKYFYENNKEVLRENENKYKELYEEQKNIKRGSGANRYHIICLRKRNKKTQKN